MHRSVHRMASRLVLVGVVGLLSLSNTTDAAGVPTVINYQARLTDNTPQQNPIDGNVGVDFRLYGSPTGNDLLWSESWPSAQVVSGILSLLLGDNGSPLDVSLFNSGVDRYLEIEIDAEILAPRQRIGSTAFAFHADNASDLDIDCNDGQVLKYSGGSWACSDSTTCPVGTMVECYEGAAGTLGVGECTTGAATCNGAGYGACIDAVMPIAEACNNLDDDCNGATDETFPGMGSICTSGIGACEVTGGLICPSGSIECDAIPLSPMAESCNNVDDDCNGTADDGLPADVYAPNNACGSARVLSMLGSNAQYTINDPTIYPAGEMDFFRLEARETDSSCGCGILSSDEDYRFHATLSVPSGAGSYEVCVSTSCGSFSNCTTVNAGSTNSTFITLDGDCSGGTDIYIPYIRVRGIGGPGFECLPYSLTLGFEAGLCF
jgi:hypothetical protein